MKNFKILSLVFAIGIFAMTSCNDAPINEARESLATTSTTNAVTPSAVATPVNQAAAAAIPAGPLTSIEFEETEYDFGDLKDGETVTKIFKFINTGNEPLIISNAKGSCGCTVPDWPKQPIGVGETGDLKVVYNSRNNGSVDGKNITKKVTVTANTETAQTFLNVKAKVFKDAENAAPAI